MNRERVGQEAVYFFGVLMLFFVLAFGFALGFYAVVWVLTNVGGYGVLGAIASVLALWRWVPTFVYRPQE